MEAQLKAGQELYSVATGRFNPFLKASRTAVDYMCHLEGFVAVYTEPKHGRLLWFYDTENNAKVARNLAESHGIQCGFNIARFVVAADGVPEADAVWARTNGRRKGL